MSAQANNNQELADSEQSNSLPVGGPELTKQDMRLKFGLKKALLGYYVRTEGEQIAAIPKAIERSNQLFFYCLDFCILPLCRVRKSTLHIACHRKYS